MRIASAVAALLLAACGGPSKPVSTLDKVRHTGTITLATREASIPFNYLDDRGRHAGYAWEIAQRVAERVKQDLSMPALKVEMMTVTPQTRIQLVANQTVDLECSSTTHNKTREHQVSFSNSFYAVGARMLVRKNSGIHDWPDLAGRRVVVSGGTTATSLLRKANSAHGWGIRILVAKDINENFMMVETGRAAASVQDDVILHGNIARAKDPQAWHVVGTPLRREVYGCMLRKGDHAFKTLVDDVIADMTTSGEMERLYRKYFQSPIAVRGGINLQLPLSPEMRALFSRPNDEVP